MEDRVPAGLSPKEGRKFGLLVGGAFLVFGGISRWRGHDTVPYVLWSIGGLLFTGGLLIPGMLGPVYRAWMGLAGVLSKITTPIFMGVVYFIVLTPVGLFRRMLGKNSLVRPAGNSFWIDRAPGSRRGDINRQF